MVTVVPDQFNFPDEEEKILQLWKRLDAFQTSLKQSKDRPKYTFYDGPPFATGLPHYGHILAGTIKVGSFPDSTPVGEIVPRPNLDISLVPDTHMSFPRLYPILPRQDERSFGRGHVFTACSLVPRREKLCPIELIFCFTGHYHGTLGSKCENSNCLIK